MYTLAIIKGRGDLIPAYGFDYICNVVCGDTVYTVGMTRDEIRRVPMHAKLALLYYYDDRHNRPVTRDGVQYVFPRAFPDSQLALKTPVETRELPDNMINAKVCITRDNIDDAKSVNWQTGDGLAIVCCEISRDMWRQQITGYSTPNYMVGLWSHNAQVMSFSTLVFSKSLDAHKAVNVVEQSDVIERARELIRQSSEKRAEVRRLTRELETAKRELEAIKHELETPLTTLSSQ